jgi:PEGA domain
VYGTLIVESDRMDAALRIDGEDCGNVPRLLLLSPGRHKVFLQAANAPDKTREVEIKVGYRTSVRINFAGGSPETKIEPEAVPRLVACAVMAARSGRST